MHPAGAVRPTRETILEAVVASYTPQTMAIRNTGLTLDGLYELRILKAKSPVPLNRFRSALSSQGIVLILSSMNAGPELICLFPVASLTARAEQWNAFHDTPEWRRLRQECHTSEISLWKTV